MSENEKEKVNKNHSHVEHVEPYTPQFGTMIPSGTQKFMRTCYMNLKIEF